jgi:mannose-1-phosphate guanylyltransferase
MEKNRYVVIMAGGIGSRFWPYSRVNHPKQFIDFLGTGRSLLQMTYNRFAGICPVENIFIITNVAYKDLVNEQLPGIDPEQVLLEPIRRNTATCIAYACYKIAAKNTDATIVVTPSDHVIMGEKEFETVMESALTFAQKGKRLLTIGIKPNRPETGFGYIQFLEEGDETVKKVKTFTEKPERDLAKKFLESGDFVWNSGIFIWHASAIKAAIAEFLPAHDEAFQEASQHFYTDKEEAAIKKAYSISKSISIDYGVMEKAQNAYVTLADFSWSDLGSWAVLHEKLPQDENRNVTETPTIFYDTKNTLVKVPKDKLVVVQGLNGYLVAECDNVLVICKKDDESRFRDFVADVKAMKGTDYL